MRKKIVSRFFGKNPVATLPLTMGRNLLCLVPYAWVTLFLVIPFFMILKISFSESQTSIPPYKDLIQWGDRARLHISLNLENYLVILQNESYLHSLLTSLRLATLSTFFCLLLAYPMAYFIARAPQERRLIYLLLVILPFWTSFLIRVYSWVGLLKGSGIINSVLMGIGLIQDPLPLLNTDFAVCLGIVYSYLPFMVLPLYVAIEKIDPHLLEASYDLGCGPLKTFLRITLPLSLPGILAGSMIVLIPALGEVVIPLLLGGGGNLMVGKVIWQEFFNSGDWPVASALAVIMLVIMIVPLLLLQRMISKAGVQ